VRVRVGVHVAVGVIVGVRVNVFVLVGVGVTVLVGVSVSKKCKVLACVGVFAIASKHTARNGAIISLIIFIIIIIPFPCHVALLAIGAPIILIIFPIFDTVHAGCGLSSHLPTEHDS